MLNYYHSPNSSFASPVFLLPSEPGLRSAACLALVAPAFDPFLKVTSFSVCCRTLVAPEDKRVEIAAESEWAAGYHMAISLFP
jgi:hypothetical protein